MMFASFLAVVGGWLGFANPVIRLPLLALLVPAGLAAAAVRAPTVGRAARVGYIIGAVTAMKVLKARLYDLELKKIQAEKQESYEAKNAIGFGSQIRTYTLQPYRLVKDHRTGVDVGDVEAVLDGDLDKFIRGYLLHAGHAA